MKFVEKQIKFEGGKFKEKKMYQKTFLKFGLKYP